MHQAHIIGKLAEDTGGIFWQELVALKRALCVPRVLDPLLRRARHGYGGPAGCPYGAQVGVLEKANQVGLAGLLQGHHGRALEPQVSLEVLGDLPDQALEGQLADQQLGALLVTTDLPQGHCSRPVSVGFLHTTSGWGTFAGSLGGQLLPGGLASSRLAGSLLGTSHGDRNNTS